MKRIEVEPDLIKISTELSRSGSARAFEERLKSSIAQMGLAEPLKIAVDPAGGFTVIDGALRLRAIRELRRKDASKFRRIPAYLLDYDQRYEIRFQSDIYQDLLPSQMAVLVEHLHASEHVMKSEIARYIGVSPATLRNYTGLWRLMQRGAFFARIVELMDVGVFPASNPYAWLRLTADGLEKVLRDTFTDGDDPDAWISQKIDEARQGHVDRFPLKFVEAATDALAAEFYRVDQEVRIAKRDLGLRKRGRQDSAQRGISRERALSRLGDFVAESTSPVLQTAASSLRDYLQ